MNLRGKVHVISNRQGWTAEEFDIEESFRESCIESVVEAEARVDFENYKKPAKKPVKWQTVTQYDFNNILDKNPLQLNLI